MRRNFHKLLLAFVFTGGARCAQKPLGLTINERRELRDEVIGAFQHAYGAYMTHAYPADELMPLSCKSRRWDQRSRGDIDDALGGYGLTMVDSLDMHAILGDGAAFRLAVETVLRDFESGALSFDRDVVVSVFEASIRVLGGLLSAHQIATELDGGERLGPSGWYSGGLLDLAYDLGKRLLPAFETRLGIPVHRVNLRTGVPRGETRETCSAAAGTFLLEFGTLSRLTGDSSFERAARRSVTALWDMRSTIGLVGGAVDVTRGVWKSGHASIGAGTDSFYEYLHKSGVLLRDDQMRSMFAEAYGAVEKHLRWGPWHVEVDMQRGRKVSPHTHRVSALQAFWPTMQLAAGDLEAAEATFDALFGLWEKYEALPDVYDVNLERLLHYGRDSPLRPELAESALALFRATGGEARYLHAGADMLAALQRKSRVECGYASVGDVRTGALDDRMDSYFLAETLKYLFLLFDSSLPPGDRQSIFCTPEEESAWALSRGDRKNGTAGLIKANMDPGNASSATISVSGDVEAMEEAPRSYPREYRGEDVGDGASSVEAAGTARWIPRCIRWDDTVLTTEGHPFLIGMLSDSVVDEGGDLPSFASPGSSTAVFDPARYYRQGVKRDGSGGPPRDAEFDVECFANGKCHFYDSGPAFLAYLKRASGGRWTSALAKLCDWVRDTSFSPEDQSSLIGTMSVTYRLRAVVPLAEL